MTVRIGVLGCGRIGKMHAELLHSQVPGASCAGVFDVMTESAQAVSSALNVPMFDSVGGLMNSEDVDAVAICTSTDTHVDMLLTAAKYKKAVFCEKPISLDLEKVDDALDVVRAAGIPLQVGFNRRFDPAHQSVRDAVAGGAIGDIEILKITSRDPAPPPISYVKASGGIFLDMMIHDFDMARYVTGSEVVSVYAQAANRVDPAIGKAGDVDTAVVTMVHDNGCITTIDNSRRAVYGYDQRVEAFGSKGMAASENPLAHTGIIRTAEHTTQPLLPFFFLDRYIPSYIREWGAFVEYITKGGPSPVDAKSGRAPLVIGLAAIKSFKEGRVVEIDEID